MQADSKATPNTAGTNTNTINPISSRETPITRKHPASKITAQENADPIPDIITLKKWPNSICFSINLKIGNPMNAAMIITGIAIINENTKIPAVLLNTPSIPFVIINPMAGTATRNVRK